MEYPSKRQRISRIQGRSRAFRAYIERDDQQLEETLREIMKDEAPAGHPMDVHEPLLVREARQRRALENKHGTLHRRQSGAATSSSKVTITVSVIAKVDSSGSTATLETVNAAAVPTVPSVPSVPPFPSTLTVPSVPTAIPSVPNVPSFPFPATSAASTTTGQTLGPNTQVVISTPATTLPANPTFTSGTDTTTNSTEISTTLSSSTSEASLTAYTSALANSTSLSSTILESSSTLLSSTSSSTLLLPLITGSSISLSSTTSSPLTSLTLSTSPSLTSSSSQSSSTTRASTNSHSSQRTSSASARASGGAIAGTAAGTGPVSSSTAGAGSSPTQDNSHNGVPTAKVVGGVVGGLAGLALLLVLTLVFLKWYKKNRQGVRPLSEGTDTAPMAEAPSTSQSFMPIAAAGWLKRMSGRSSGVTSATTADTGERGFQRVSGRKLPSAFSEGITSEQMDSATLSGSSFYRDSTGFYGGPGAPPSRAGPSRQGEDFEKYNKETLMPSPARTPVVHHPYSPGAFLNTPGDNALSPPQSPGSDTHVPQGTLGRSHPSYDGSRGSKFTEDV